MLESAPPRRFLHGLQRRSATEVDILKSLEIRVLPIFDVDAKFVDPDLLIGIENGLGGLKWTVVRMNLDLLLKLRVTVGRHGEMDLAKWWNTKSQLGRLGASALRRGFPRTHYFAQARSVMTVAAHRCKEIFDPPSSVTLWHLDQETEDAFDARWEYWLDHAAEWQSFFQQIESISGTDLSATLQTFGFLEDAHLELLSKMRRSAEGRAVPLNSGYSGSDEDIRLLALGFARGEVAALAVPYARKL